MGVRQYVRNTAAVSLSLSLKVLDRGTVLECSVTHLLALPLSLHVILVFIVDLTGL